MVFSLIATVLRIVWDITFVVLKFAIPIIMKILARVMIPVAILSVLAAISGLGGFIIVIVVLYMYSKKVLTYDPKDYDMPA